MIRAYKNETNFGIKSVNLQKTISYLIIVVGVILILVGIFLCCFYRRITGLFNILNETSKTDAFDKHGSNYTKTPIPESTITNGL